MKHIIQCSQLKSEQKYAHHLLENALTNPLMDIQHRLSFFQTHKHCAQEMLEVTGNLDRNILKNQFG